MTGRRPGGGGLWPMSDPTRSPAEPLPSRRGVVRTLGLAAAAAAFAPGRLLAGTGVDRALSFVHTHTREKLSVVYTAAGAYVPDALMRIDRTLRDHYTGDVHRIDTALLDLLHELAHTLGTSEPFHVISGYRSLATNAMLRARSRAATGVARRSLHMDGRAIDIRVPRVRLTDLRDAALDLARGGVGYYPNSNFVHVDTGRVRRW
jgi:uncharacterized protein YcbK (DUF882 family)